MPVPHRRPEPPEIVGRWAVDGAALRLLLLGFTAGIRHERGKTPSGIELETITGVPNERISEIRTKARTPAVGDVLALLTVMHLSPAEVLVPRAAAGPRMSRRPPRDPPAARRPDVAGVHRGRDPPGADPARRQPARLHPRRGGGRPGQ